MHTMSAPLLGFLGSTELIIILVIVVVIFGVGKLPDAMKQLGSGIKGFKSELNADDEQPNRLPAADDPSVAPRDITDDLRS